MLSKWKSRLGVFAVLAMIATVLVALPVSASARSGVDTGATIGSGDNSYLPNILCKWELPDSDRNANNGMQYYNDDDPSSTAANPLPPCQGDLREGITYDPTKPVIEVKANAENKPTERLIELWAAVQGPNGTAVRSVNWDIWHPDGTPKIQVYGAKVANPRGPGNAWATYNQATGQYDLTSSGMWAAASSYYTEPRTRQLAWNTVRSQWGLISMAVQNKLELWKSSFLLDKHQPCGEYLIEAQATGYTGRTAFTQNTINVLCFVQLEADFDTVQWDAITPGETGYVAGDLTFGTANYPTVKNTGSGAMTLGVEFSDMIRPGDISGSATLKKIDVFDAAFGTSIDQLEVIDPIDADEAAYFGNGYYQTLCANEIGKLDLSIHPPGNLPEGNYVGSMTLIATHSGQGSPCLNEAGVWRGGAPAVRFSYSEWMDMNSS